MKLTIFAAVMTLLTIHGARAQDVSIHPAEQPPDQKAAQATQTPWQRSPDDVPKQFLSNIQSRIGLLESSEMEARANETVTRSENARLQTEVANLQRKLKDLTDKMESKTSSNEGERQ
jgi:hypothetical protein